MIDHETIERIKDAAKVEEVVGEFVTLHRKGLNMWGCCPFHNEKTPSFSVSPAKGFYKCFGCGEHGNSIGFLMKHEHYTYVEALQWLAKKYHIEIVEKELSEEQKQRNSERDTLYHVSEFAQKYFVSNLFDDEMGRAVGLSYFHKRGLSDDIIREFGLGYCLDEWRAFTDHARKNGYSDAVLEKTGLTIFKEGDKCFDRFRARVTFPIFSVSGRVLGFSCRILTNDKAAAKYVNSPDSEIYNKSNILYGIFQAKSEIARQDKCYLVEGNLDVVSMHQSGVKNTVASCGTSLTNEQIRLISRFTKNVTILYDGDAAGIKATKRAVDMLYSAGMKVRMVLFPDGDDPDSYAQKYGSTQLQEYLRTHEENFILYKMRLTADEIKRDPIQKTQFQRELLNTIALVPDLLERNEYVAQCASLLSSSEQALHNELARIMSANAAKPAQNYSAAPATPAAPAPVAGADEFADYPGPLPDPEDYTPISGQPAAASAPVSVSLDAVAPHERKIIELLVNYGTNDIIAEVFDDDGKVEKVQAKVAQVIVAEFITDNIGFQHPVCQKLFDIFSEAVTNDAEIPDSTFFVMHEDLQLQSEAISFMKDPPEMCKGWAIHKVYPKTYESGLTDDVRQSVLSFKLNVIDSKIAVADRRMKTATGQELIDLLYEKHALVKRRQEICSRQNLRRVFAVNPQS